MACATEGCGRLADEGLYFAKLCRSHGDLITHTRSRGHRSAEDSSGYFSGSRSEAASSGDCSGLHSRIDRMDRSRGRGRKLFWRPKSVDSDVQFETAKLKETEVSDSALGMTDGKFGETEVTASVLGLTDGMHSASEAEDDRSSVSHSIPGDSAASSGCESETQRACVQPLVPSHGDCSRGESSKYNAEPEVGNVGFFCGNWGQRGSIAGDLFKKKRREAHDRQIMRCPAQVVILCEASAKVEEVLKSSAVAAEDPDAEGLAGRGSFEHYVVRGNEPDAAILVAARCDNCTDLKLLDYDVHLDHTYTQQRKKKMAKSRMLTCKVGFKQNVGHIGKSVTICGVHGNFKTMKLTWPQVYHQFWDRLASKIRDYDIEILAGDFNMSLTRVIPELRSRGIQCDCIAWYPWVHETERCHDQPLGFDSCGIFYIGGSVQATLKWGLYHLGTLTAGAAELTHSGLDTYSGDRCPGQPWKCYRSFKEDEKEHEKDLGARLTELLTPSTPQADLDMIPKRAGYSYCPYLRFSQKPMDINEWLVEGGYDPGSHFPLCVFTNNARARSAQKQKERAARYRAKSPKKHDERSRGSSRQDYKWRPPLKWNAYAESQWTPEAPTVGAYVSQCLPLHQ